ncbi:hypothetical protein [Ostreiculturibacter nitratireducens]|uniref:hypothetical protein n=1 Tax=Ostreiculturibacter nitratireducens TaxID=3075226 RepID=UPI0031B6386E
MTGFRTTKPDHYIAEPEAVGIFDNFESFQAAMYDLLIAGFSRYDISVLASQETVDKKFGKRFWRSAELQDDPEAPRTAFVSEEAIGELEGAIAGGFFFLGSYIAMAAMAALAPVATLAGSVAGIAIGGAPGAVIGSILARRVGRHHKDYYATQIEHGGILLWVRVADHEREKIAVEIIKGHSGRDVHVHPWSEA